VEREPERYVMLLRNIRVAVGPGRVSHTYTRSMYFAADSELVKAMPDARSTDRRDSCDE
jgi:hypothetical protein